MTKSKQHTSRIPEFKSREEEAEWFDTHDMADYQDEFKTVKAPRYPSVSSLRGAAGSLKKALSGSKMREIAREALLKDKYESGHD